MDSLHFAQVVHFFVWFNGFRRLGIRSERVSGMDLGFLHFAAIVICLRRLLQ